MIPLCAAGSLYVYILYIHTYHVGVHTSCALDKNISAFFRGKMRISSSQTGIYVYIVFGSSNC